MGGVQDGVGHVWHSGLVSILEERLRAELRARLGLLVVFQLGLETDLNQIREKSDLIKLRLTFTFPNFEILLLY